MTDPYSQLPIRSSGSETYRSLSERFSDIVNVRDFGAKGDGTTPDDAAIQAAIEHVAAIGYRTHRRGSVYIPPGIYKITNTITVPRLGAGFLRIFGEGHLVAAIAAYPRIAGNLPYSYQNTIYNENLVWPIESLSAKGVEVTARTLGKHQFRSGDTVAVFWAQPESYDCIAPVTVTGEDTFSYRLPAPPGPAMPVVSAMAAKIDYPAIPAADDIAGQCGGACFSGLINVLEGLIIDGFRYGIMLSGYPIDRYSADLIINRVEFANCNIALFGYSIIQAIGIVDCAFNNCNAGLVSSSTCFAPGNPYKEGANDVTAGVSLIDNRGYLNSIKPNINLDLWFYHSILRPDTPSGRNGSLYPYRQEPNRIPPSAASVSGHAVFMPARNQTQTDIVSDFRLLRIHLAASYRSAVVCGALHNSYFDHVTSESAIIGTVVGRDEPQILVINPSTATFSRIVGVNGGPSVKIVHADFDASRRVIDSSSDDWIHWVRKDLIAIDCDTPCDCPIQIGCGSVFASGHAGDGAIRAMMFSTTRNRKSIPLSPGDGTAYQSLLGVHYEGSGFVDQGVHRVGDTFLFGANRGVPNENRLLLVNNNQRAVWADIELFAARLDNGDSDYAKIRVHLVPFTNSASPGSLAQALRPGDTAVTIAPAAGLIPIQALNPGVRVAVGGNRLVVRSYDAKAHRLAFWTGATAEAAPGTVVTTEMALTVLADFASGILKTPTVSGHAIAIDCPLFARDSTAPVPVLLTYSVVETVYFDGSPP